MPEHIARALVEEELAKRHVAQQMSGLVLLPAMTPKPEPPAEFWTQASTTLAAALRSPTADAAARIRAIMRAKRYGSPLPTFEAADGA